MVRFPVLLSQHFLSKSSSPGRDGPSRARRLKSCDETPCLFGLAPCGVYHAATVTSRAVGSYPAVSPLPSPLTRRVGGLFSVALAVQPACADRPGRYPAHCPAEFGLSSPLRPLTRRKAAIIRPPALVFSVPARRACGSEPDAPGVTPSPLFAPKS